MTERSIEDGLIDCPRFGIMDEQRCIPSCEFYEGKDQSRVDCSFGEVLESGSSTAKGTDAVAKS
ncbi:MAG: hypothetical protein JW889_07390 [Verrucomicrobia bacterium]|nr:hypothetical protein [Verrucomicrobiota bacterium]